MTLEELRILLFKKVDSPRKHKVTLSLGVYDAYKYIRKHKWFNIGLPITEHLFYVIIRELNKVLAYNLTTGKDVKLPHKLGTLELRKVSTRVDIVNGKIVTTRPIDWDTTLKLWSEDLEAYSKKMLIRLDSKEVFRVNYNKKLAQYNNKAFYNFSPTRDIKQVLKRKIKNKEIDAFKLYE